MGRHGQQAEGALYTITPAGRRQLSTEKSEWDRMASIIHSLLRDQA